MEEKEIPKIIHYCWFGGKVKPKIVLDCIESWKRIMPNYEIIEWNENNFDVNSFPYTKKAYSEKKWAFVSDVARLKALYDKGGIYLDTDMYVLKKFDDFLQYDLVLGKEDKEYISAGMIACTQNNQYVQDLLKEYKTREKVNPIPVVMTTCYKNNLNKYEENKMEIKIFDPIYFYSFTDETITKFNYKNAPIESYAVHLWNYSWGNTFNKILKKLRIYRPLISLVEKLKIKKILKKIFNVA